MMSRARVAGVVSVAGCVGLGLLGFVAGWPLWRDEGLVGVVPVLSSAFLVVFAALSVWSGDVPSPENLGGEGIVRAWTAPAVMVALVGYLLLLGVLGFMLDTGLLILVVLLAAGVRNVVTAGVTVAALLGIGVVFQRVLGIELPAGMF